eukprot:scaffold15290_cov123-Isochrysis_galbana.AAC.1
MQRTCSAHIHLSDVISPAYSRAPASRTKEVLVGVPAPAAVLYTCHATPLPCCRTCRRRRCGCAPCASWFLLDTIHCECRWPAIHGTHDLQPTAVECCSCQRQRSWTPTPTDTHGLQPTAVFGVGPTQFAQAILRANVVNSCPRE